MCLEDGLWSFPEAYCKIECAEAPNVPDAKLLGSDCLASGHNVGSVCRYKCNPGFYVRGSLKKKALRHVSVLRFLTVFLKSPFIRNHNSFKTIGTRTKHVCQLTHKLLLLTHNAAFYHHTHTHTQTNVKVSVIHLPRSWAGLT